MHGEGPVIVALCHHRGNLVIDVTDSNPTGPQASCSDEREETGRGLALVEFFATRSGWEPCEGGKRVWASIALPKPTPTMRAAVLRRLFSARQSPRVRAVPESLTLAVS